jgi:hypothetical protein
LLCAGYGFAAAAGVVKADEPQVSLSGYILADFQYYVNHDGKYSDVSAAGNYGLKPNSGFNTFEVPRAYLTFSAKFSDKVSALITTDLQTDSAGYRCTDHGFQQQTPNGDGDKELPRF